MKKYFTVLFLGLLSATLAADTVVLTNGDSIQGTLVRMEGGKAIFKTELAGEISIAQKDIQSLTISTEADFKMADGTTVKSTGELTASEIALAGSGKQDISSLTAINPSPTTVFSGNITAGLSSSHGNTYAQNGSVSVEARYDTPKGTTASDMTYVATRTEDANGNKYTSEEFFTAGAKREFNLSEKTYAFLDGRYKTDHIADLDRRLIGTLGLGRRFVKSDNFSLNGDLGLSELHEKYTVDGESDTNDSLSVRMGYNMSWDINTRMSFKHNLEYYPSTEQFSDYYLTAKAELRYKFSDKIYGSFKTLLDYDAIPAEGNSTTDTKYILGLGIDF